MNQYRLLNLYSAPKVTFLTSFVDLTHLKLLKLVMHKDGITISNNDTYTFIFNLLILFPSIDIKIFLNLLESKENKEATLT